MKVLNIYSITVASILAKVDITGPHNQGITYASNAIPIAKLVSLAARTAFLAAIPNTIIIMYYFKLVLLYRLSWYLLWNHQQLQHQNLQQLLEWLPELQFFSEQLLFLPRLKSPPSECVLSVLSRRLLQRNLFWNSKMFHLRLQLQDLSRISHHLHLLRVPSLFDQWIVPEHLSLRHFP